MPTKIHAASALDLEAEIAELQVLLRALGEEAIMMRNGGKLAEKEKSYFGDIVTEADRLIEHEIVKRVQSRYPDHCVNGEETGPTKPAGGVCEYEWIVNPINGTTNFSKGLEFFSIAVALLRHGDPILGVFYFPELHRFVHAVRGKGAFDNGRPLVRFERPEARSVPQALIAGASPRRKNGRYEIMTMLGDRSLRMLNFGSIIYNCMLLADGKIDAVVHTDATTFNITPVIPILGEAGCLVSGFREDRPDLSRPQIPFIAASNAELLEDIKRQVLPIWDGVK
ncbi:MAG TPA: inositol monophosphatase [Candidatus Paceibacterota bacterium]|nr:inositol monophosphatase [Candidatus Paceibacterota bacterium]